MAITKVTTDVIVDDAITSPKVADDLALSGNPTATTQSAGNNTTRLSTTAFVTTAVATKAPLSAPTFTGDVDIDATDDLRLRFLRGSTFKGGIQVPTSTGDMISGSAVDDLAIRSQGNLLFSSGGNTERMRIDSSGNIGIGITSPSSMLHLFDGGTDTSIRIQAAATADNTSSITFDSRLADNTNKQVFLKAYRGNISFTGDSGYGNVGIGTTNPQHPFHVYLTNGELAMFGSNQMNSVGQYAGIGLGQVLANNTTYQKVAIVAEGRDSGSYVSNLHFLVDTAADGNSAVLSDSKMMISGGNGYVGIGTTDPDELLEIVSDDPRIRIRDNTAGGGVGNGGKIEFMGHHAGASDGKRVFAEVHGLKQNSTGGDTKGEMIFKVNKGSASTTEVFRLESSGALAVGDSSNRRPLAAPTYMGYANYYRSTVIGSTSASYGTDAVGAVTLSFNYDPSGNTSGSFSGDGSEVFFRRSTSFRTPNSANNGIHLQFTMTDGVTSGDFNDTSDRNLKQNIKSITNGFDVIKDLNPVLFDWKDADKGNGLGGFIAQEVETVLPNDVLGEDYTEGERGQPLTDGKSINTVSIVAHLVKALQEVEARVKELEK